MTRPSPDASWQRSDPPEGVPPGVRAGRDGWLFRVDGDARALEAGASEVAFGARHAQRWRALLDARTERLAALGASYVHLVVPDKLTLEGEWLDDGIDRPLEGPLKRFAALRGGLPLALLDIGPALARHRIHHAAYARGGDVWTPRACHEAYRHLCLRLGVPPNRQLLGYRRETAPRALELGRTCVPPRTDDVERFHFAWRSRRHHANELVTLRDAGGRDDDRRLDEGSHVSFRNDHSSAIPRCLMLFGDACSDIEPHLLSGMLAETFREVHFVWAERIDDALIERVRPDIVVSQGVERRMGTVPEDGEGVADRARRSMASLRTMPVSGKRTDAPTAIARPADAACDVERERGVVRRTLLPAEVYHLDPPNTVQADCVADVNDTAMHSNPVTLLEVADAKVFFTGGSWSIHDASGDEVAARDVDPSRERRRVWQRRRTLRGLSLLFGTSAGAHCYYHWMLEILPRLGLLERAGTRLVDVDHVLVREITGDWQLETLARFGIGPDRIVETAKRPHLHCERVLHIDLACGINLKMPRFVPLWMRHLHAVDATDEDRLRLYLGRPERVRRGVSNEAAMRPLLEAAGIESVVMEGRTVREQAMLLARADVVVAPHGGALTNMVFCRPGTRVVELLSRHVYPYYYGLAASCGHVYHAVLENAAEDYPRLVSHRVAQAHASDAAQRATASRDFAVPLEALARTLERV